MLKILFVFIFLLFNLSSTYAGTPSATDSTSPMKRPTQYMYKYLNVDRTNINNPAYTVTITALNSASFNNCPISTATTSRGLALSNIQYVQIGVFGQVPQGTALNDANYYNWGGNLWSGVTVVPCSSGCCSFNGVTNCPYWIYDYSSLRIICAPMFSDWTAGTV